MTGGSFPVQFALWRKVQEFPRPLFRYEEEFAYDSAVAGGRIVIPRGYLTDKCSIPRIPFVYMLAGGLADEAGGVHDLCYSTQLFEREKCDEILREAVIAMGYSEHLAQSMFEAVRMFGGSHWTLPNVPQDGHVDAAIGQGAHFIPYAALATVAA